MPLIGTAESAATGVAQWEPGSTVVSRDSVWKRDVHASSFGLGNVVLVPAPATIDGVALVATNRYGILGQAAGAENGIYTFDGADLVRANDFDTSALVEAGVKFYTQAGTANAKKTYRLYSPATTITVGVTVTLWEEDGGGGGGGDLAATLVLGNITGGTDIAITDGDKIQGEGRTSGSGSAGGSVVQEPGIGGARVGSGTFTVVTAPLVAGDFVKWTNAVQLTGVVGARTPGSNNFSVDPVTTAAMAIEIAAAMNDPLNTWNRATLLNGGGLIAVAVGSTIVMTNVFPGSAINSKTYFATTAPSGGITPTTATNFTGGVAGGGQGAFTVGDFNGSPVGDARGDGAVDLQGRRALSTQVAAGARSFQAGYNNRTAAPAAATFGSHNINHGAFHGLMMGYANRQSGGYGRYNTFLGTENVLDTPTYTYSNYANLIMGTQHSFNEMMGMASSTILGRENDNTTLNPASWTYCYKSLVSGYRNRFSTGGIQVGAVMGSNNTIGSYFSTSFAFGAGLVLGEPASPVIISNSFIWGGSNRVAENNTSLSYSHIGGAQNRADTSFITTSTPNLRDIHQWGRQTLSTIQGEVVWGCESNARQLSFVQVQGITTNATPRVLRTRDSTSPSTIQDDFKIRPDQTISFTGTVTAQQPLTGDSAMWEIDFLIKNLAGTTSIVGTPNITLLHADAGALPWAVSVAANNTADTAEITVTGEAVHTIQWNCLVRGVSAGSAAF